MKIKRLGYAWAFLLLSGLAALAQADAPPTLVLAGDLLAAKRDLADDKSNSAIREVTARAEQIVKAGRLYSVINKAQTPPGGDKRDYMSQAPYWWPDPSKPNGLPYIRRDGERNPELNKITDKEELGKMMDEAELTAVAYFFTRREDFAAHSARLLRTWFLDEKTRQNPHLKFAQGIPGLNAGRGIGLIETRELYRVIDAAILLTPSKSWPAADHAALRKWFSAYCQWMLESDLGREEAKAKNNHGTHYDAQIIAFSLFAEKRETARRQIEVTKRRLRRQLAKDGSMPLELERALSWDYAFMNLCGFFTIARLAEHLQVDLWNFEVEGKGLRRAVEWLKPFANGGKTWPYQQIKPSEMGLAVKVFSLAAKKYNQQEYQEAAAALARKETPSALELLLR
jgi:hypothetical protein